jgi:hopanoid C-3 methylase
MRLLAVHPSGLMYTRVFLTLEPLGLELVAAAARNAGHDVRLVDLQVEPPTRLWRLIDTWQPDAVCLAGNYLANVPEIIDTAKTIKSRHPGCFVFVGGHSASFIAADLLAHAEGAIDCVIRGEGEPAIPPLLHAVQNHTPLIEVPGAVTPAGEGPPPRFVETLDTIRPARDLLAKRHRYFIGPLDPCASIEFARGCPWDCTFCSAWTFYGRSYRIASPEIIAEELAQIREPGIFIVDDVAFIHASHGFAIGEALLRRNIQKQYYLETRGDVLLRNLDVFRFWRRLGLKIMFIGLEAIDAEGLQRFRKRIDLDHNMQALEAARSLDIAVAVNLIADPSWDRDRFETVRRWCLDIPEVVNLSVTTPYPGTEIWQTEQRRLTTRDYRLFDIQHAVLPTTLPLPEFYAELVKTQQVLNRKHLGFAAIRKTLGISTKLLLHGQTNFLRMIWKFNSVFNPDLQLADHARPVDYELSLPPPPTTLPDKRTLYIHQPTGRRSRTLDSATERFVDASRSGASEGTGAVPSVQTETS